MKHDTHENGRFTSLLVLMAGCVSLWVAAPWFIPMFNKKLGSAPDSSIYDALNALFSGMAFAGVIFAIMLQRKELAMQNQELLLTREESEKQSVIMEKQMITLKHQIDLMQATYEYQRYLDFQKNEPSFDFTIISSNEGKKYVITNIGNVVYQVKFKAKSPNSPKHYVDKDVKVLENYAQLDFVLSRNYSNVKKVNIDIEYRNKIGLSNSIKLELNVDDEKLTELENTFKSKFNIPEIKNEMEIPRSNGVRWG